MASDPGTSREVLKGLAHDLGNLAFRLTLLSANLESQIADAAERAEAVAMLRDTTERLRQVIEKLREVRADA